MSKSSFPDVSDPNAAEPPEWFRRRRDRKPSETPDSLAAGESENDPVPALPAADVPPPLPDSKAPALAAMPRVKLQPSTDAETDRHFFRDLWNPQTWRACGVSLLMHLVFLGALSLVWFAPHLMPPEINNLLLQQEDPGVEIQGIDDTLRVEPAGRLETESIDNLLSAQSLSGLQTPLDQLGPAPSDLFSGSVASADSDKAGLNPEAHGGFQMPAGSKTVRKGSFTVWTVPEDPGPGEDYLIVIQVEYKRKAQKLQKGDVTGLVVGTDRFRKVISPLTSRYVPDANQVIVHIPGGDERVRDSIRVYSQVLRESQRLEIIF